MTKAKLINELNYFYATNGIGLAVYALMKDGEIRKLDIEGAALPELKNLFLTHISENIIKKEDLNLLALSSADERRNAIYEYDLDTPNELSALDIVIGSGADQLKSFDMKAEKISDVKALLIEIGDRHKQMVLYKLMPPINIYERGKFFLKKMNTRFVKVEEDFFRISPNFQLMKIDGKILVLELEAIERMLGFHDVIKNEASLGVDAIVSKALLENPETLHELLEDVSYARKLTKIAKNSPVLQSGIENEKIISFCQAYPSLAGKIRFNAAGDKILLDTKVSKSLFVKLLMDDFLTSELTSYHYVSVAKDNAEVSIEIEPQ